jgi:transcription factor MBP1
VFQRIEEYDNISSQLNDDETPDHSSLASASFMEDEDMLQISQNSTMSRKRKRAKEQPSALSTNDQAHLLYADELLDYFMLSSDDPGSLNVLPPEPPVPFQVDRPIDDAGHTALHWAAAMGDIEVIKDLLSRGADPKALSKQELTPLMRSVMFTNNYEKGTMPKLVNLLQSTIGVKDFFGATVFHHLAQTCGTRSKWQSARYYCETIINKLSEVTSSQQIAAILNAQDNNNDTAVLIAARHGAKKVAKAFLTHYAAGDIPNSKGEIADEILLSMARSSGAGLMLLPSSSPFQPDHGHETRNGHSELAVSSTTLSLSNSYNSQAALNISAKVAPMIIHESEKLAKAFDEELKEKEAALAEGRRLQANLESERHYVQLQMHELMGDIEDEATISERREEYGRLVRENESLLEQIQHVELHHLVRSEEQKVDPALFRDQKTNQLPEELEEKWRLGNELSQLQKQRRDLVKQCVKHQSHVGTGERTAKYRRLVALTTAQKEEDLDDMSAELLEAVRGDKMDEVIPSTPPRQSIVV